MYPTSLLDRRFLRENRLESCSFSFFLFSLRIKIYLLEYLSNTD